MNITSYASKSISEDSNFGHRNHFQGHYPAMIFLLFSTSNFNALQKYMLLSTLPLLYTGCISKPL